jgi:hypothetical protein
MCIQSVQQAESSAAVPGPGTGCTATYQVLSQSAQEQLQQPIIQVMRRHRQQHLHTKACSANQTCAPPCCSVMLPWMHISSAEQHLRPAITDIPYIAAMNSRHNKPLACETPQATGTPHRLNINQYTNTYSMGTHHGTTNQQQGQDTL